MGRIRSGGKKQNKTLCFLCMLSSAKPVAGDSAGPYIALGSSFRRTSRRRERAYSEHFAREACEERALAVKQEDHMWKFVLKRLLMLIPVLIGVTLLVFLILNMAPGDPAKVILGEQATPEQIAELREQMGLNDPVLVQYGRYIVKLVQGDMGDSYKTKGPVSEEVFNRFPNTIQLTVAAMLIAIVVAIPLGVIAAVKQNTIFDGVSMIIALIGVSMPIFWLGLLLILLFSLRLGWFPVSGKSGFSSIVLPAIALGFNHMASIARTTRSSMLETIRQDYIRTVRAKGVAHGVVIRKHALKNALIPVITVIGLQIGYMLGGSVLTETVFAWPGVGRLMVDSINGRDIPMVMGCIILVCATFSLVNLAVDILYGFVDPRIKSQYKSGGKSK